MPRQMSDLLSEIVMANKLSPKDEMVEGFVDGMTIGRSDPVFNRHEMYGDPDTGEGGIVRRLYEMKVKNGWIDQQGRVYIICTIEESVENWYT